MDGFKNTTRTQYDTASGRKFANGGMTVSRNDMAGGEGPMSKPAMVAKYAKGGSVKKGEQKIGRVMKEFTEGKLHSGSKEGPKVKSTKQAVAIALNEARAAGAKIPRVKKAFGGEVDDVLMARMTKEELAQGAKGVKMAQERLERKSVKRGVPPSSDKPLISPETMREIRHRAKIESAGVAPPIRKAMGGMTLSNVPQSKNSMPSGVGTMRPSKTSGATAPTLGKTPSGVGTERPSKTSMAVAPNRGMTLGMNKGGVAKKAAGGMTLSNAPTRLTMSNAPSSAPAPKVSPAVSAPTKASAAPAPSKMSAAAAPSRGLTLSGPNVGRRLTLGMNKGGLSVMPKGKKGC